MPKLFIIDDEPTFQEMVKPYFELRGFTVFTAISGEEALPEVAKEQPEVILLDMHLKGKLNGIGILKEVKEKSPSSAVVMLTGMEANLKNEALSLGAARFLTKPITLKALDAVVAEVLNKKS